MTTKPPYGTQITPPPEQAPPAKPDTHTPLLRPGYGLNVTSPAIMQGLGPLAMLVGNWHSPRGEAATGYNVIALPSFNQGKEGVPGDKIARPGEYLMKNFPYYEQLTFSAIPGTAANRGGDYQQNGFVLLYEQRVYFADGPDVDTLIHAENGMWLHLRTEPQPANAYGDTPTIPLPDGETIPPQPLERAIVKQLSVPHGNSALAPGKATVYMGPPTIPSIGAAPPFGDLTTPYGTVKDPYTALSEQLAALEAEGITVVETIEIEVDVANPGGGVQNTQFEQKHAEVTGFNNVFYIERLSNGQVQIQYRQAMVMSILVHQEDGTTALKQTLHADANTLTPVPAPSGG